MQGGRRGTCAGNGNGQNGVGPQTGFIPGAVRVYHGPIHAVDVCGVHSVQRILDGGADVPNGLSHAFSTEPALVSVAQLQGLELAGGRPAGGRAPAPRAAGQQNLGLHGGIAAGINDFPAGYTFNMECIHKQVHPFCWLGAWRQYSNSSR